MGEVFGCVRLTASTNSSRDAGVSTFWSSCIIRLPYNVKFSLKTYSSLRVTSEEEKYFVR